MAMVSILTPLAVSFALLLSLLLLLHASQLLPRRPIVIAPFIDELDDLTLFRHATATATATVHPHSPPTPRIAFLFLINSNLHFAPLWELFFRDHHGLFNIYIHADPSCNLQPPGGVFTGRFIPGKPTQRASPTLITATRRLIATALLHDPSNSFFVLLSQHCIPLHTFHFIYHSLFTVNSTLSSSSHHSYIEILDKEPQLWSRYIARGSDVMIPEVPFSSFRIGSQFFILTRPHALLVVNDTRLWSKFSLPCLNLHTCYPEEHYFPTLLDMEDPTGCKPFTLTNVNWTGSVDGHPHTYGVDELSEELIRRLRVFPSSNYSYLFARKFSPDCLEPLLEMADGVLFRE